MTEGVNSHCTLKVQCYVLQPTLPSFDSSCTQSPSGQDKRSREFQEKTYLYIRSRHRLERRLSSTGTSAPKHEKSL